MIMKNTTVTIACLKFPLKSQWTAAFITTNEPVILPVLSLVWRYIINICTECVCNFSIYYNIMNVVAKRNFEVMYDKLEAV
jgi:hypothetical protein